jgi:NTP pyrophosphatase (non-canonical NTP hydrolase)
LVNILRYVIPSSLYTLLKNFVAKDSQTYSHQSKPRPQTKTTERLKEVTTELADAITVVSR